ncbi:MAG: S-methyl-5'-thioadenosine phosphorylase [Candidatus Eremiobacteraeota bacterium]|nr:S-methyl-5'-thioadenosine phosphorylase [Candidatus Eremiobacteraeota bacterium]MBV8282106.1 S-methyl-5'-thioadenosine phosphorylase [Candidatus Eremiobacteraeota bacterium]
MKQTAEIGVFGGSGFYSLLDGMRETKVETPYGAPSDVVALGEIGGRKVAFLPRHGKTHSLPPHVINYRANIFAMKELGVTRIIGPTAAGSLQGWVKPGDFVVSDQLVDRTNARKDTFYDGPVTTHVSFAHPYCPQLRDLAVDVIEKAGIPVHEHGTVVCIQGPRFSTVAESRWYAAAGWEVINMTQYPEAYLARELEMCYANIALITDYDVGLEGEEGIEPVTHEGVIKVFNENNERVKKVIQEMIARMPKERTCSCGSALQGARLG